jgi:anti-sigma regulatory factor (Ser/Thr protein kinase)
VEVNGLREHATHGAIRQGATRFSGDTLPTDPARFRRWARSVLGQSIDGAAPVAVDDVVLVVGELVNNAGEHAKDWVTVDLLPGPDGVLVAVSDPEPDRPALPRAAVTSDESGRGLLVVSRLADRWGVLVTPTMKTVWAWLPAGGTIPRAGGAGEDSARGAST